MVTFLTIEYIVLVLYQTHQKILRTNHSAVYNAAKEPQDV